MSMDYELHDKLDMYHQMYLDCDYDMQSARKEAASRVLQEIWRQIKSWRDKQQDDIEPKTLPKKGNSNEG